MAHGVPSHARPAQDFKLVDLDGITIISKLSWHTLYKRQCSFLTKSPPIALHLRVNCFTHADVGPLGGMDLTDVPIDQLVAEVSRRMHCLDKPEKRVIMVGKLCRIPSHDLDFVHRCITMQGSHFPPD